MGLHTFIGHYRSFCTAKTTRLRIDCLRRGGRLVSENAAYDAEILARKLTC